MKVGRRRYWIYLLLFCLSAINYVDRIALSVSSQAIAKEFDLSPVALGYLFSSFLWTYILCLLPMGMLVDRYGTRISNAVSISVWSIATMLTGAAGSFSALIATRLAMGAGEASTFPAGIRTIREWVPVGERGVATAIFNSGAYAGPAFGAIFLAWISSIWGWRGSFVIAGAIGFVWLAAWLIWFNKPEKVSWLGAEERQKILSERDVVEKAVAVTGSASKLRDLLREKSMWGLALTQGCAVYTQYLFLTWLPSYLQATRDISILKTGLYTAISYGLAVILGIALGRLSDLILTPATVRQGGRRKMVVIMMLCSSIILAAPFVSSVWGIVALVTVSLTGISTAISMNFALANDLLRNPQDAGKATSIMVVGGNVFGVMAPIVTGYVIVGSGGYGWAFGLAGILLLIGAVTSLTLTRQPIGVSS
ncbi:MFS transporter [Tardiphaga sp.]|uniref:MFS transporter n=1 Tax=Tardiphaga sp. TaxID=1926292 RepID=UPI0025F2DFF9|nr:MFS transporter [Tardiphaga sp.]